MFDDLIREAKDNLLRIIHDDKEPDFLTGNKYWDTFKSVHRAFGDDCVFLTKIVILIYTEDRSLFDKIINYGE